MKRIRFVISGMVVKEFSYAHTWSEFVEVSIDFTPVNASGIRAKRKSSSKQLSFVVREGDVGKINYR